MNRHLLSALTLSLLAGVSGMASAADVNKKAAPVAAAAPAGLASGIAVEYIDPAVRAQDDLFQHLNGKWLAETVIPADKSSWGSFAKLADDTQTQLRGIVEGAAADKARAPGSNAQKIGDFYNSFMDEARLESLGLAPLNAELAKIAALQDKKELPAVIAHFSKLGVTSPYDFGIHQDAKDSTKYVADIVQSGLGLPDRDYYLEAAKADTLAKIGRAHV